MGRRLRGDHEEEEGGETWEGEESGAGVGRSREEEWREASGTRNSWPSNFLLPSPEHPACAFEAAWAGLLSSNSVAGYQGAL